MARPEPTSGEIMTDEDQGITAGGATEQENQVQMRIEKVYLKDASFECRPDTFLSLDWLPQNSRPKAEGKRRMHS